MKRFRTVCRLTWIITLATVALPVWSQVPDAPETRLVKISSYRETSFVNPQAIQSTGLVTVPDGNEFSVGSCTYLGSKLCVTASHVMRGIGTQTTVDFGHGPIRCVGFLRNKNADQFILELEREPGVPGVRLADSPPAIGETVYGYGFAHGNPQEFGVWSGRLIRFSSKEGTNPSLQETAVYAGDSPVSGDSGGGVFNQRGEYVGNVWGTGVVEAAASAVRYEETRFFLQRTGLFDHMFGGSVPQTCTPGQPCAPAQPIYPQSLPQPGSLPTPQGYGPPSSAPPTGVVGPPLTSKQETYLQGPVGPAGETGPQGPKGDPGKDAEVSTEQLAAIAAAITQQLKADPDLKGPKGDPGVVTPAAIRSVVLEMIASGDISISDLTTPKDLASFLPPVFPRWIDKDNQVVDEIPGGVRLGQTMPLRVSSATTRSN